MAPGGGSELAPFWIKVDLQSTVPIGHVFVSTGYSDGAYDGYENIYKLYASNNDVDYTLIAEGTLYDSADAAERTNTIPFPAGARDYRYLRYDVVGGRHWAGLFEFQIFAPRRLISLASPRGTAATAKSAEVDQSRRPRYDARMSGSFLWGLKRTFAVPVVIACLCSGSPGAPADKEKGPSELYELRIWAGKNGSEFVGALVKEEGKILHIQRAEDQKVLKIAKSNLSPRTLAWFENTKAGVPKPGEITPFANSVRYDLMTDADIDRTALPVLDQSDYGTKASDCLPNSYAAFFLWWDQKGKLTIPKGRDFEAKAQWIHRELSKRCGTRNNSGTSFRATAEGLREYFANFYEDKYRPVLNTVYDVSPASLAKHTKGMNATVLCLSTYEGRRLRQSNAGYHAVSLIDVQENGRISLATWGILLHGQMTPLPEEDIPREARFPRGTPPVIYEVIFDEGLDTPKWFRNQRFIIDPSNHSRLDVLSLQEREETPAAEKKG